MFLERVLTLGPVGKVLVLHLRGETTDRLSQVPHWVCLPWFTARCCRYQRIHLHCFTSGPQEVTAWKSAFPHAYFELTSLVKDFTNEQKRAVQNIPLDRLLLESDAPHLPVESSIRTNTPRLSRGNRGDGGQDLGRVPGAGPAIGKRQCLVSLRFVEQRGARTSNKMALLVGRRSLSSTVILLV